jgi:hypothetical protein
MLVNRLMDVVWKMLLREVETERLLEEVVVRVEPPPSTAWATASRLDGLDGELDRVM